MIANTRVIDISRNINGRTPKERWEEEKATRTCLRAECERVKLQAQKEMGRHYGVGGFVKNPAGEFVTPEFARVLKEKESPRLFGKITIPNCGKQEQGVYRVLLDRKEITSLNARLLPT
eukprot:sb/3476355/